MGVGCVQRAAQATRQGALQLQDRRRSLWLTPAYMMLACHGPFDFCAFMLCAEEQHSWTCVSEVSEPAPQYFICQRHISSSAAGCDPKHQGGPSRQSSAASMPPSRAPGRSIPPGRTTGRAPKDHFFAQRSVPALPRITSLVSYPPIHETMHFRCMSTCEVVTPDLSLPPSL